jgi:hypothetical protein
MDLKQHLSQLDLIELRAIAQNQGLIIEQNEDALDFATELGERMLEPEHVLEVWQDLPEASRVALGELHRQGNSMPVLAFERRFGEIRQLGPGRLQTEQPWKHPTGPAERLWWLGWLTRSFREIAGSMVEVIGIPRELTPLLPLDEVALPEPAFPHPVPEPEEVQDLGELLLDDLGTILAYVQNHPVKLRTDGRWRYKDLHELNPRLRLSQVRQQPLEAGGPLHLLFFAARRLGLIEARQGYQRLGRALRPWLETTRSHQMLTLFQVWREAEDWNDLCLTPELYCQEGAWENHPRLAREALLAQLGRAELGAWYDLDEFIGMIYEHMPDFQRPDANYDTWYIQNGTGEFLRGFEHWPAVEGALIRYLWRGPLFWLGVVALDAAQTCWQLTPQGEGFLRNAPVPPPAAEDAPILQVRKDFRVILAPHIGLWDRLRVALFTFWQRSEPRYEYLITQRGLKRAQKRGVSTDRILAFLDRASGGAIPRNVRRALERFEA